MNPIDALNKIKKLAQVTDIGDIPARGAPRKQKPATRTSTGTSELRDLNSPAPSAPVATQSSTASKADIKHMQDILRDISATVIRNCGLIDSNNGMVAIDNGAERAKAKDSFNNFFVQNYMAQKERKTVSFPTSPQVVVQKQKEKLGAKAGTWRMNNVMDTVARIGSQLSEQKEDGIWGFRTQTSLRNISVFTECVLEMLIDFRFTTKKYSMQKLGELNKLLDQYDKANPKHLEAIAVSTSLVDAVIKNIQDIPDLYRDFYQKTIDNPYNANFIDGSAAFAQYGSQGENTNALDQRESQVLSTAKESSKSNPNQDRKVQSIQQAIETNNKHIEQFTEAAARLQENNLIPKWQRENNAQVFKQDIEKLQQQNQGYEAQLAQEKYLATDKQVKITFSPPIKTSFGKIDSETGSPTTISIDSVPLSALEDPKAFDEWTSYQEFNGYGGDKEKVKAQVLNAMSDRLAKQQSKYTSMPSAPQKGLGGRLVDSFTQSYQDGLQNQQKEEQAKKSNPAFTQQSFVPQKSDPNRR